MGKTYHQLSELNKSGLFPKLKTRPLIPLDYYSGYTPDSVAQGLTRKVSKLKNDALVLKYIEMLPDRGAIKVLTELGDDRAFKPLQQIAIIVKPIIIFTFWFLRELQTHRECKRRNELRDYKRR